MIKGVIGVPTGISTRWAAFYECLMALQLPEMTGVKVQRGNFVSENRNKIVEDALKTEAEWIFFLDDDLLFEPNCLNKLLERNVDAVVGLSLRRSVPFFPLAYRGQKEDGRCTPITLTSETSGLIEIDAATAGGLLIRRNVFEKMQEPYFKMAQIPGSDAGEDLWFCMNMRKAGFKLWLDTDVRFGHIADISLWPTKGEDGWSTTLIQSAPFTALPPAGDDEWNLKKE